MRTIYRDIADLIGSGVPIDGEAGVGYVMREGYDLPPLMFTRKEISALLVGARLVSAWGGAAMALNVESALSKIESILPSDMRGQSRKTPLFALDFGLRESTKRMLDRVSEAIESHCVVRIRYADKEAKASQRAIEPLAMHYWGKAWTLVAWCRLREGFRVFRVDRIRSLEPTGELFVDQPGRTLRDYLETCVPPPEGQCSG